MFLSLLWLRDYLLKPDVKIDLEPLSENLTMLGFPVASVKMSEKPLSHVVVGKIVKIDKHPNADRLQVTQVITSNKADSETHQIVCGAKNIAVGDIVPVALPGATLPGDFKIKKSAIRGVDSFGMICSAKELGISEDGEGILQLPKDFALGELVTTLLGKGGKPSPADDTILELELTPNRADCLSMIGLAREIAPLLKTKAREPKPVKFRVSSHRTSSIIKIEIQDNNLCKRYVARIVDGLKVAESPKWIQDRLKSVGISPVNNIVDITNFVMMEYGIPLHAFDLRRVESGSIQVGPAKESSSFTLLNGDTVTLEPGDILIKDGEKPIALAGIMGGENSQIQDDTTSILLEAACFHAPQIRKTAKRLGIHSESSKRFERGVDLAAVAIASERAAALLRDTYNANVYHPPIDTCEEIPKERTIALDMREVRKLVGVKFPVEYVIDVLETIQISCVRKSANILLVRLPSFRVDLNESIDVIEEIARLAGYDRIPEKYPTSVASYGQEIESDFTKLNRFREFFCHLGFRETIHYSFTSENWLMKLGMLPKSRIELQNPINEEMKILRDSLLPSLAQTYIFNRNRKSTNQWLFEVGKRFVRDDKEETTVREIPLLSGLQSGEWFQQWNGKTETVDFYFTKGVLESFFKCFTTIEPNYEKLADHPLLHPVKAASLTHDGRTLGVVGEVHPFPKKYLLDAAENLIFFELNLEAIKPFLKKNIKAKVLSKFPAVELDLAFTLDKSIEAAQVRRQISSSAGPLLKQVSLFDFYSGDRVPSDKKSLAFRLHFQSEERTLKDEEVSVLKEKVISDMKQQLGADLRA